MNYNVKINSDNRSIVRLGENYFCSKDFTLTVKAVNDAPIVMHPLEESYLTGDAAMELNHV